MKAQSRCTPTVSTIIVFKGRILHDNVHFIHCVIFERPCVLPDTDNILTGRIAAYRVDQLLRTSQASKVLGQSHKRCPVYFPFFRFAKLDGFSIVGKEAVVIVHTCTTRGKDAPFSVAIQLHIVKHGPTAAGENSSGVQPNAELEQGLCEQFFSVTINSQINVQLDCHARHCHEIRGVPAADCHRDSGV